jgi:hypothetical protein
MHFISPLSIAETWPSIVRPQIEMAVPDYASHHIKYDLPCPQFCTFCAP